MTILQKIKILFFPLLVGALLNSCSVLKKKKGDAEIISSAGVDLSLEKAYTTPEFTPGDWPDQKWWEMFNDPNLNQLVEKALINSPTLKAAIARVMLADQTALSVRSAKFPDLGASFDTNYEHLSKDSLDRFPPSNVPAVINQINLALNFKYELDFWGKNQKAFEAAVGKAYSQKAEQEQAKLIIVTSLVQSYLNYEKNLHTLDLKKESLLVRTKLLELTQLRMANGLDNLIDVDAEIISVAQLERDIEELLSTIEVIINQMRLLVGESPDSSLAVEFRKLTFDHSFPLPDDLSIDLLARRPDLMALIWNVEAAAHEIGVAKTAFYPNIDITALIGLESLHWNNLFTVHSFRSLVNPAVHLPLFTGGRLKANLLGKWADYDIALEDYNQGLLTALQEVSDQLTLITSVGKQITLQQNSLNTSESSFSLYQARFTQGISNYLEVLQAQESLIGEQMTTINLNYGRLSEMVGLIKAMGGGYHSHPIKKEESHD